MQTVVQASSIVDQTNGAANNSSSSAGCGGQFAAPDGGVSVRSSSPRSTIQHRPNAISAATGIISGGSLGHNGVIPHQHHQGDHEQASSGADFTSDGGPSNPGGYSEEIPYFALHHAATTAAAAAAAEGLGVTAEIGPDAGSGVGVGGGTHGGYSTAGQWSPSGQAYTGWRAGIGGGGGGGGYRDGVTNDQYQQQAWGYHQNHGMVSQFGSSPIKQQHGTPSASSPSRHLCAPQDNNASNNNNNAMSHAAAAAAAAARLPAMIGTDTSHTHHHHHHHHNGARGSSAGGAGAGASGQSSSAAAGAGALPEVISSSGMYSPYGGAAAVGGDDGGPFGAAAGAGPPPAGLGLFSPGVAGNANAGVMPRAAVSQYRKSALGGGVGGGVRRQQQQQEGAEDVKESGSAWGQTDGSNNTDEDDKALTPEEKLERSRVRNRDHSRKSRQRKKALVEGMKKQVTELGAYRMLVEQAHDLISAHTTDDRALFLYASGAFQRLLGINAQDLLGVQLVHMVHPDDIARVTEALRTALLYNQVTQVRYRLRHHSRGEHTVETSFRMIPSRLLAVTRVNGPSFPPEMVARH